MSVLCDSMIPLLGVLLIVAGQRKRPLRRRPLAILVRLAAALAWVYVFHFGDMYFKFWKGWGLDFSAHTGVAVAVGRGSHVCLSVVSPSVWASHRSYRPVISSL